VGEEPNHTTGRKPGPLLNLQYSLAYTITDAIAARYYCNYLNILQNHKKILVPTPKYIRKSTKHLETQSLSLLILDPTI
jgi:hypothetical protein